MATTRNIQMQYFNGTDYDTLYPQTSIDQTLGLKSQLNSKLSLSGGTMTGSLVLNGNPTQSNQAVNKNYLDQQINSLNSTIGGIQNDLEQQINSLESKIEDKFVKIKEFAFNLDTKQMGNRQSSTIIEVDLSSYDIIKLLFYLTKNERNSMTNASFSLGGAAILGDGSIQTNKEVKKVALSSYNSPSQRIWFIGPNNQSVEINSNYALQISHTAGGPWAVEGTVTFYGLK